MKIEGRNAVYELIKTDREIDKVLVQADLKDDASRRLLSALRGKKVKIQFVDKRVIEKESASKRHQGFIAFVSDYEYSELEQLTARRCGRRNYLGAERNNGPAQSRQHNPCVRVFGCGGDSNRKGQERRRYRYRYAGVGWRRKSRKSGAGNQHKRGDR